MVEITWNIVPIQSLAPVFAFLATAVSYRLASDWATSICTRIGRPHTMPERKPGRADERASAQGELPLRRGAV